MQNLLTFCIKYKVISITDKCCENYNIQFVTADILTFPSKRIVRARVEHFYLLLLKQKLFPVDCTFRF